MTEKIATDTEESAKKSAAGRPKSNEKRQQILFHAAELFMEMGFERTSMDAVAKASGVSKQTVYSHFNNKDALYNSVIEHKCTMYQIDSSQLNETDLPLNELLQDIAFRFIQLLHDPQVMDMYITVIGESRAYPRVAELFYSAGPKYGQKMVATLLQSHPQSKLSSDDAHEVALDFFNLLKSDYHICGILNLSYGMNDDEKLALARKTTKKTMAIIALYVE